MQSTLNNSKNIICKTLSNGGIAILPTDTIYSLSCITSNTNSLKKILKIKGRDAAQGMPVLVPNIDYFNIYAKNINSKIKKIINTFMPGPLTLILNKKPEISDLISGPNNTIALRIPDNADLIDLIYTSKSTMFLNRFETNGKKVNGLDMLIFQALKSIEIWNETTYNVNSKIDSIIKQLEKIIC